MSLFSPDAALCDVAHTVPFWGLGSFSFRQNDEPRFVIMGSESRRCRVVVLANHFEALHCDFCEVQAGIFCSFLLSNSAKGPSRKLTSAQPAKKHRNKPIDKLVLGL